MPRASVLPVNSTKTLRGEGLVSAHFQAAVLAPLSKDIEETSDSPLVGMTPWQLHRAFRLGAVYRDDELITALARLAGAQVERARGPVVLSSITSVVARAHGSGRCISRTYSSFPGDTQGLVPSPGGPSRDRGRAPRSRRVHRGPSPVSAQPTRRRAVVPTTRVYSPLTSAVAAQEASWPRTPRTHRSCSLVSSARSAASRVGPREEAHASNSLRSRCGEMKRTRCAEAMPSRQARGSSRWLSAAGSRQR